MITPVEKSGERHSLSVGETNVVRSNAGKAAVVSIELIAPHVVLSLLTRFLFRGTYF